jgi:hypothetical protein
MNPQVKPAKNEKDLGVVSYMLHNTKTPEIDERKSFSRSKRCSFINHLSWKTTEEYASNEENLVKGKRKI